MHRTMGVIGAASLGALALMLVVGARAPREVEAASLSVFSSADSGPGSFRAAVEAANADSIITEIVLRNWLPVTLYTSVDYTGTQALTIRGDNPLAYRTIQGSLFVPGDPNIEPLDCGMLRSTGGADVTFSQVTVQHSWCDALNIVPVAGDDEIVITLNKVVLRNNFGSGLFLHEIEEAEAAIRLHVTSSLVTGNGRCRGAGGCAFGGIELQGVGQGSIDAELSGSAFNGNGGDGLSVAWDEAEVTTAPPPVLDIDLTVTANSTSFNDNGGSVPVLGVAERGSGRGPSIASHQSGNGLTVAGTGLGAGTVSVTLTKVQASGNAGDGVEIIEGFGLTDDTSNVVFAATSVLAWGNGSDGLDVAEFGDGALEMDLASVSTWSNGGSGVAGSEEGDGDFGFEAAGSSSYRNGFNGFSLEAGGGDGELSAEFNQTVVSANGADGIHGDDAGDGFAGGGLSFEVSGCTIVFNGDDAIDLSATGDPGTLTVSASFISGDIELDNVVQ
ncbi:MAG: hypothetical protein R3B59_06785 [Dehalococcoidia bacterium]